MYQLVPARLWVWFMSQRNQRVRERQLTVGARERGGVTFSKNRSTVSFAITTTPDEGKGANLSLFPLGQYFSKGSDN